MTKVEGVIDPVANDTDEMFIGWAPAPAVDRRFLLGALPLGLAASVGSSWLVSKELGDPGAGAWQTNATHRVTGVLSTDPYPMLRIADPSAPYGMRTVLIVAQGKCTSALQLADVAGKVVTAAGALIQRKERQMLEVPLFLDKWLEPADDGSVSEALLTPDVESIGSFELAGQVMDSKCFFGVMRPGRGKTHKACASLCIRGGIPPSMWVRNGAGGESVLLLTGENGGPMPMDILPFVADPVSVTGEVVRVGDLLQLRANLAAFQRV